MAPQSHAAPVGQLGALQQSIARIQEACQAPPLSPPEYRLLFELLAQEIGERGLQGGQTLASIQARAHERGVQIGRDDVRFVLDVVGEPDPWFEQGASAPLFAGRFRNFVVARCRSQGLSLAAEELDLVETWFGGSAPTSAAPDVRSPVALEGPPTGAGATDGRPDTWWLNDATRPIAPPVSSRVSGSEGGALATHGGDADEYPRILRTRVRN